MGTGSPFSSNTGKILVFLKVDWDGMGSRAMMTRNKIEAKRTSSFIPPGRKRGRNGQETFRLALGCEVAVHLGGGSVIVDTRRGDGPRGAGIYTFAALATTDAKIETTSSLLCRGKFT